MTPQETATAEQYFPVHLAVMQPGTTAPVDLFMRQEGTGAYVLYKKADAALTADVRRRLMLNGVQKLYMRRRDEEAFQVYLEQQADAILHDTDMPAERLLPLMCQSATSVMKDLFQDPRSGSNLSRAAGIAESLVAAILRSEKPLHTISSILSYDYYTYTHSVNVCAFLVTCANALLGIEDTHKLNDIAHGGILHDVGKSDIPRKILNKPGKLTEEEFELIKRHPAVGLEIVRTSLSLGERAESVIRGHHERQDGTGYPDGARAADLDRVVQLATIVDVYDALTTNRPYAAARTPYEALHLMVNAMEGHFDDTLLRSFIRFLGPEELRGSGETPELPLDG